MSASFEYVLRLGDNALILGQRLTEWLGHSPAIEEDIASANVSLDLIGQARLWLTHAGKLEGRGRDEDDLAYDRGPSEFRNCTMVELPNGDFAFTIVRRQLFDTYYRLVLERLARSEDPEVVAIAAKSKNEADYHHRHSGEWVVRLGDGTRESHRRTQDALVTLWPYAQELFVADDVDPEAGSLRTPWLNEVRSVFTEATLELPSDSGLPLNGRQGRHSEHLGPLLAEMQSLRRAHPGANW
jgi:ring-1,2-phenylacetyl-CoA epoxidase subunit PaaC